MKQNIEDDRTEGPEGYFVQSAPPAPTSGERRHRQAGRRVADLEMRRARKRLIWTYAAVSAVLAVAVVVAAASWL